MANLTCVCPRIFVRWLASPRMRGMAGGLLSARDVLLSQNQLVAVSHAQAVVPAAVLDENLARSTEQLLGTQQRRRRAARTDLVGRRTKLCPRQRGSRVRRHH